MLLPQLVHPPGPQARAALLQVAGGAFAWAMQLDVTVKGHGRMSMDELCIYEVEDGKIVSERFTARLPVE